MVDMVAITAAQSLRSRVKGKLHLVDKSAPGTKQTADQQHVMRKEKKKNKKKKEKEMCAQWKEADITIPDVISANEPQDLSSQIALESTETTPGGGGGGRTAARLETEGPMAISKKKKTETKKTDLVAITDAQDLRSDILGGATHGGQHSAWSKELGQAKVCNLDG